ncbi:hypothetical protein ACUR5C_08880 [Aliikangiella sp. IMCC44653]
MILNRKSNKGTSKVSLIIAVTMIVTVLAVIQTQGYPIEELADGGVKVCQASAVSFLASILW